MRVYIKGMEMPKCCNDCWALNDDGDYPRCRITEEQRGYTFNIRERKMSKCPLIEASEPPAEIVEVVRCKDCRWYERPKAKIFENCCRNNYLIPVKPNDYCSYGERKEESEVEE